MDEKMALANNLRREGRLEEARDILLEVLVEDPNDPQTNYSCACVHDGLGREREAIPFYERAIEKGLSGGDLEEAKLGLGSSYRCVGEYHKAVKILGKGVIRDPENRALQVFLSMSLYNLGDHRGAMELLLRNLAETSGDEEIAAYKEAILYYSNKLDQTW